MAAFCSSKPRKRNLKLKPQIVLMKKREEEEGGGWEGREEIIGCG